MSLKFNPITGKLDVIRSESWLDDIYLRQNGTTPLTANWDAGSYKITAETFESDVTTGTAPLTVASTTLVSNLNADLLDSQEGTYYLDWPNFTNTPTTLSGYGISDTKANFDTALSDGDFAYSGGAFHDGFSDFVANEHIDHSGVTLTAGDGLTGGGDISANRTFNVVGGDGITANADSIEVDYNTTNLKITSAEINTIQDISIASSPTFADVTISNSPTNGTHATNKDYVDGLVQGLDWQESVLDIVDNTAAPPTEVTGDRYLLDDTGGGVNAGWDGASVNDIVEFNGTSWEVSYDASSNEGGSIWVEDEDVNYTWNGTNWVKFGSTVTHNNLSGLQGGTTAEYYHLTSAQHTEVTDFFGATDITGAEAETLTDSSNADALHTHTGSSISGIDISADTNLAVSNPITLTDDTVGLDYDSDTLTLSGSSLTIAADGVGDTHIDWGTGANQVSGVDVPLADAGTYFTTDNVEAALQELGADSHVAVTLNTTSHDYLSLSTQEITLGEISIDDDTDCSVDNANLVDKSASETISGEWTYSTFPITPSAAPDANYEVANKKYVDDNEVGSDTRNASWTIASPETGGIPAFRIPEGLTVTRVDAYVTDGTSVTFNIEERSTIGSAGTNILTTDMVADTNGESVTSSFNNDSLASGNWLWIDISAVSGTVSHVVINLTMTLT